MKEVHLPDALSPLVCEGGFPSREAVLSLALSIGVFHGVKGKIGSRTDGVDIEALSSYSLAALVVSRNLPMTVDIDGMRTVLAGYLEGGLSMMEEKLGNKRGPDALEAVARLLPG